MERSASSLLSWLLVPVAAMLVASAVSLPQRPYTGLVLIGGWVWSERRDPLTRAFFLMCIAFAWLLPPLPLSGSKLEGAAFALVQAAATVFLPGLVIHFFALFPDRDARRGLRRVLV